MFLDRCKHFNSYTFFPSKVNKEILHLLWCCTQMAFIDSPEDTTENGQHYDLHAVNYKSQQIVVMQTHDLLYGNEYITFQVFFISVTTMLLGQSLKKP